MYRYHKHIGFPTNLRRPHGVTDLEYSGHAERAARTDRFCRIAWLPSRVRLERMEMVECDADDLGNVYKAVYRTGYKPQMGLMLVLVVLFADEDGPREVPLVKTVWLNPRDDRHATLHSELYDIPEGARR